MQIHNYIAPKSLAKTSTTDNISGLFHHSPLVHDDSYSAVMYERDRNGQYLPAPLVTAAIIHRALGEEIFCRNRVRSRIATNIDPSIFNAAIRRALAQPTITCYPDQLEGFKIIDDKDCNRHLIIRGTTGSGKSSFGDVPILARHMQGVDLQRTLIVPPHNSLLAQFIQNSHQSFRGTSIRVWALDDSATLENELSAEVEHWDLLYLSTHTLNRLLTDHRHTVESWGIKVIIIDECHLLFGELFRHSQSWKALHNLAALKAKMVLMSGTMNKNMIKMLAHYTGMGSHYKVIGNTLTQTPPNVSINNFGTNLAISGAFGYVFT